jgi:hypothetical protein
MVDFRPEDILSQYLSILLSRIFGETKVAVKVDRENGYYSFGFRIPLKLAESLARIFSFYPEKRNNSSKERNQNGD